MARLEENELNDLPIFKNKHFYVGAIIGAVGAIAGGLASSSGAAARNRRASELTDRQIQHQNTMSVQQYQRAMYDMERAGLNPILAYKQGGSGVTQGATYQPENEKAGLGKGISEASASAMAMKVNKTMVKKAEQETKNMNLQSENIVETYRLLQNQADEAAFNATSAFEKSVQNKMNTQVMLKNLPAAMHQGKVNSDNKQIQVLERYLAPLQKILGSGNSALDLYKPRSK